MNADKSSVLFVCPDNASCSRFAEALLIASGGGRYTVTSAGFAPAPADAATVAALAEIGLTLRSSEAQPSVFDHFDSGAAFDYVITVGVGPEHGDPQCPLFPGVLRRLAWRLSDPSVAAGSHPDEHARATALRDAIQARIDTWLDARRSIRSVPGDRG